MSSVKGQEITVWTIEGYEGRFLEWENDSWQAFDYRNFRHWFSPPQSLTEQDMKALRATYRIGVEFMADEQLIRSSPEALVKISGGLKPASKND